LNIFEITKECAKVIAPKKEKIIGRKICLSSLKKYNKLPMAKIEISHTTNDFCTYFKNDFQEISLYR
jgi:hypothetical protein